MKKILGYVGRNDIITKADVEILTHIHVAFGHLTMEGDIEIEHLREIRNQMETIRSWNSQIKIILSIVPKEPDAFTDCSGSSELRGKVGAACAKLITEDGFDGIDFDWEYPCVSSNGMNCKKEDKENFTLLCKAAQEEMAAVGGGIVSIAAGADLYYIHSIEPDKLGQILDYVCVMTYDLKCGFHALTGHHTALYSSTGDIFRNSADQALRLFHEAGIPKEKLLLGAAFYARQWENIQDRNHGFLQISEKGGGYGPGYTRLVEDYVSQNGYIRYWDDEAKAPFLFDGSTFLSYDDEESVSCKCEYVKQEGYGGIFYWDHQADPSRILLRAIGKCSLNGEIRKTEV